jgi:hypothetical protein
MTGFELTDLASKKDREFSENIFLPQSDKEDCGKPVADSAIPDRMTGFGITDLASKKECDFGENTLLPESDVEDGGKLVANS